MLPHPHLFLSWAVSSPLGSFWETGLASYLSGGSQEAHPLWKRLPRRWLARGVYGLDLGTVRSMNLFLAMREWPRTIPRGGLWGDPGEGHLSLEVQRTEISLYIQASQKMGCKNPSLCSNWM